MVLLSFWNPKKLPPSWGSRTHEKSHPCVPLPTPDPAPCYLVLGRRLLWETDSFIFLQIPEGPITLYLTSYVKVGPTGSDLR
jgi:hypothetical protein